ncbi:MAG TPA: hypothetical protein VH372_04535 [Actinospica sp.]|nr:hypothetical protein [Actinospica sp.]
MTGDGALADVLGDFCSRWQRGVANLATEGQQIAGRLTYAARLRAADAFQQAAGALAGYARMLSWAQSQAATATNTCLTGTGPAKMAADAAGPDRVTMAQSSGGSGGAGAGGDPNFDELKPAEQDTLVRLQEQDPGLKAAPRARRAKTRDASRSTVRFSQRLSADHLVLGLREDEGGFGDVADRGRADHDSLQARHRWEATLFLDTVIRADGCLSG